MASIRIQDLRKTFGSLAAVDGIDLNIADGEFVALLGPSGCGKTTTLRMIAGLEVPDSGSIHISDRDVTALPPRDRDVAMVFQDYALYPHMTLLENIGYPLKVRGVSKDELQSRVSDVARNLQIGELLERRPGQLSGGQQQRAAVARAVVHQAQVFLFDEPLSNLDAKLRLEARAFLKHLQQQVGVTAVYVTHDQAEAMALADRLVVMDKGRIMQVGTPLEVYRQPANTFVASFIGNPPMNLIPCQLNDGVLVIGTQRVTFDASRHPGAAKSQGAVILGIRPEHLTILNEPAVDAVGGELYVIQNLGGESIVVVQVDDMLLSVRIYADELPDFPKQIWVRPDVDKAFFYGQDGALIS